MNFKQLCQSIKIHFGFSKSQLCAVLKIERTLNIANYVLTVKRINTLEKLSLQMEKSHLKYLGKMAFGALGHNDLALALLETHLDINRVLSLYYTYWNEFDGLAKRALIKKNCNIHH